MTLLSPPTAAMPGSSDAPMSPLAQRPIIPDPGQQVGILHSLSQAALRAYGAAFVEDVREHLSGAFDATGATFLRSWNCDAVGTTMHLRGVDGELWIEGSDVFAEDPRSSFRGPVAHTTPSEAHAYSYAVSGMQALARSIGDHLRCEHLAFGSRYHLELAAPGARASPLEQLTAALPAHVRSVLSIALLDGSTR